MTAVITDAKAAGLGRAVAQGLSDAADVRYLELGDVDIKPCYSCGGCKTRSFKRCVFRDDADTLLPYAAQASVIVLVTPIVFGGYSYSTKLLVDKFALIGSSHYYVNKKELVLGKDPATVSYYAVGVTDGQDDTGAAAFKALIRETQLLTNWLGGPIVSPSPGDAPAIVKEIKGTCKTF